MIRISMNVLTIAVVVLLYLPLAATLKPELDTGPELQEKRELEQWPGFRWRHVKHFPHGCELFFDDNFGYRSTLVRWNAYRKFRLLGEVPGTKVMLGRDGWLFYGASSANEGWVTENHRGGLPGDNIHLFGGILERVEQNRDYFAKLGAEYALVAVPDKWTIYADKAPAGFESPDGRTTAELLYEFLDEETDIPVIDVRDVLASARAAGQQVYDKGETHWNGLGAFLAARAILERLPEPYRVPERLLRDDFATMHRTTADGDLLDLIGMDGLYRHDTVELEALGDEPYELTRESDDRQANISTRHRTHDGPRVVVIRDSFGTALIPYLSRAFGEVHYVWSAQARADDMTPWLKEIQPDLVLEIKVERFSLDIYKFFNGRQQLHRERVRRD